MCTSSNDEDIIPVVGRDSVAFVATTLITYHVSSLVLACV